jgi:hypothetical protein
MFRNLAARDEEGIVMSTESKKSMGWTSILIILGVAAMYDGTKSLALLIPAAVLVWYGSSALLRSSRGNSRN